MSKPRVDFIRCTCGRMIRVLPSTTNTVGKYAVYGTAICVECGARWRVTVEQIKAADAAAKGGAA